MYEIDFLPVGDGKDSGDAIALRFTHPVTGAWVHVVIDAGFQDDGKALVEHVRRHYETDTVDLAILTHPDDDHIGGMGEVVRGLRVDTVWLHDLGGHGGHTLRAADAVQDLIGVTTENDTQCFEAWAGKQAFGGAITILGPDEAYYDQLVQEQLAPASRATSARDNTSMITLLSVDGRRLMFTGDAGVPALERAWDFAEALGPAQPPTFVQVPHHGTGFISVAADSDESPCGGVVDAYLRRGAQVIATAGKTIWLYRATPASRRFPSGPSGKA